MSKVEKLAEKWAGKEARKRIRRPFRREPPLRDRIVHVLYRLQVQDGRLDQTVSRLEYRGKELFDRCVRAVGSKDMDRAAMYANECGEIKKITKLVLRSQLALEQVTLRLQTVEELGDVMAQMAPVVGIVRSVKKELMGVIPEVAFELGHIDEVLSEMVMEAGEATGTITPIGVTSEEAQKILNEASMISEERVKEKFPELPAIAVPSEAKAPAKSS